jgi:hypothetical protein
LVTAALGNAEAHTFGTNRSDVHEYIEGHKHLELVEHGLASISELTKRLETLYVKRDFKPKKWSGKNLG